MQIEAITPKTGQRRSSRPSIAERAAARLCPNCGNPSPERRSAKGPAPLYCRAEDGRDCKREMNNRNLRDGLSVVTYLKAWRIDRGTGEIAQASFKRLCDIADMLNEEDRTNNRPRADYPAAVQLKNEFHSVCDLRYGARKRAAAAQRSGEEAPAPAPKAQPDPLAAIRAKLADATGNERAILQAALEIMAATAA
jgi:hypothetical protein